jgi:hypothetical protein
MERGENAKLLQKLDYWNAGLKILEQWNIGMKQK